MLAEMNLPSKGKFIEGIRKKQRRIYPCGATGLPGPNRCIYCLRAEGTNLRLVLDHITECNVFHCLAERNQYAYDSSIELCDIIEVAANCGSNVGKACDDCNNAKKGPVLRLMNTSRHGSGLNDDQMVFMLSNYSVITCLLQTSQIEDTEHSRERLTQVLVAAVEGTADHFRAHNQPNLARDLELLQSGVLVSNKEERWAHLCLWLRRSGVKFEVYTCNASSV